MWLAPSWLASVLVGALCVGGVCLAQSPGGLRGTVIDRDLGVPLGGARVQVVEAGRTGTSNADGSFLFERVPPGTYTMTVAAPGYERQVLTAVAVAPGRLTDLRVELGQEVYELEELVVTGTDLLAGSELELLEIRAEALTVQDSLSSEVMSKAGVSDVAGALKLVTGASVADGKYATVRGLSDRYTGTTLNGVRIPSADPRRRAVQVDLFPTGTIESVTVTKTFTPDLQGDFTGGGVDIRTKAVPDDRVFTVSASIENDSLATGENDYLTYHGGGVTASGFAGDSRDLPEVAREGLPALPTFSANPTEQQMAVARQYDELVRGFSPTMGVTTGEPDSNRSFSVVYGDRVDVGDDDVLGFMGALTWSHKYGFYQDGLNNRALVTDPDAPLTASASRLDTRGSEEVILGFLGTTVWRPSPSQELGFRLVANQAAEDVARYQVLGGNQTSIEQNQSLHYTERTVASGQLYGSQEFGSALAYAEPRFGKLSLDWVLAYNLTGQEEPDVRFFRNTFDLSNLSGRMPSNSTDPQNSRRIFREIDEDGVLGNVDLELPFRGRGDTEGGFKFGLAVERTDRAYDQRSFTYQFPQQLGSFTNAARACNAAMSFFTADHPGQLWTDVFLDPWRIGLAPEVPMCSFNPNGVSTPARNQLLWYLAPLGDDVDYTGTQDIDAFYGMVDLPLTPRLGLVAGARVEQTTLEVVPVNELFGNVTIIERQPTGTRVLVSVPQDDAVADIEHRAFLPALGLVWDVVPDVKLRASWSRTVARPTFRELAPVATEEFLFGDEFVGNPDLTLSSVENWDLRAEWFFGAGELVAASLFYKELTDPIELLSFAASNRSFIQPVNFGRGEVRGAELEGRVEMRRWFPSLAGLAFGANGTLIDSEVEVPEAEQASLADFGLAEETRRLQGQPEHVVNFNVTYDREAIGLSAGLFYNLVGDTLVTGAARGVEDGIPNVFATASSNLDFRMSKRLFRLHDISLSLRVRNLLRDEDETVFRTPSRGEVIKSLYDTGLRVSLGAGIKW